MRFPDLEVDSIWFGSGISRAGPPQNSSSTAVHIQLFSSNDNAAFFWRLPFCRSAPSRAAAARTTKRWMIIPSRNRSSAEGSAFCRGNLHRIKMAPRSVRIAPWLPSRPGSRFPRLCVGIALFTLLIRADTRRLQHSKSLGFGKKDIASNKPPI